MTSNSLDLGALEPNDSYLDDYLESRNIDKLREGLLSRIEGRL